MGIEPTSEELRSPVSPCAAGCCISPGGRSAGSLPRGPARFISVTAFGRDGDPARQTASIPDRRAGPREGRGYLRSQCVVVIGSCVCLHPFYERVALDTLPTTETVPRRTQYAPKLDSWSHFSTLRPVPVSVSVSVPDEGVMNRREWRETRGPVDAILHIKNTFQRLMRFHPKVRIPYTYPGTETETSTETG